MVFGWVDGFGFGTSVWVVVRRNSWRFWDSGRKLVVCVVFLGFGKFAIWFVSVVWLVGWLL